MDWSSMEHWLCMMDQWSMGNSMMNRSVMDNWCSVDNWCSMYYRCDMDSMGLGWCIWLRFWHIRVGFSLISHISNESIVMVSMVGHNLDTTIRQLDTVLSYISIMENRNLDKFAYP